MNIFFLLVIFLLPLIHLLIRRKPKIRLPPGSLGIPFIGQSLSLLRAMKLNTAEKWWADRAEKYGPISKLTLFGKPTVFIHGQVANKLVFTSSKIGNSQAASFTRIFGDRNLLDLNGEDHKRIRSILVPFLKPDSLKNYIGKIEEEITRHLDENWRGKQSVTALPLMKVLTFNIICSVLFGIERGAKRESFIELLKQMIDGVWSIAINLPFTRFNGSLKARESLKKMVKDLISEKRMQLEKGGSSQTDLITSLLSMSGSKDGQKLISEEEMIDNIMFIIAAGYDTSSTLITFMIRALASDPCIYATVLREQEGIRSSKVPGDCLTWEDLTKMKYTWSLALETLRVIPIVLGNFRTALTDIEYEGYTIPKGWQISWVSSMTHMDGSIFQEPLKFDPSRFEDQTSIPPYTFIPFGSGPRICPGYEFAKIETLVTIHYLVTEFTWQLCGKDEKITRDPFPAPNEGLPIQIVSKKGTRTTDPDHA